MGTPAKHGKKRKSTASHKSTPTSARKARKVFERLSIDQFRPKDVGTRVLSCGEGEQLGHPGRSTTRKPRAVDTFPEGTEFVQVAAGGVHSLVLTTEGTVFSCGINEKGTVPVRGLEAEGTTDEFIEIVFSSEVKRLGKIVQITAGASFSAALTEKGSVIAWGNLRDTQGEVNVHETLTDIQKKPVVVMKHKSKENWHIVKIEAGENHLVMLSNEGEILTFGEGSMGQLGRSVRTEHIRARYMVDDSGASLILRVLEKRSRQFVRFVDIWASGFWTIGRAEDGRLFACGLNNFGQLGVAAPDKQSVAEQKQRRRATATGAATAEAEKQPATMEALNFDELDIAAANQASSEDSSQEQEGGECSANDKLLSPEKDTKKGSAAAAVVAKKEAEKMEEAAKEEEEPKQNGNVGEEAQDEEDAKQNFIGKEEANKVALITWAQAFPADKQWTHLTGVQHVVCRNADGALYGIGKNTDNALGIGSWEGNKDEEHWRYDTLQCIPLPDGVRAAGVDATLGASIFWTDQGKVFGFGCDTVGQLGLGIKDEDEKVVPTPRQITSAHLDGYKVLGVSVADNHALFLAALVAADPPPSAAAANGNGAAAAAGADPPV